MSEIETREKILHHAEKLLARKGTDGLAVRAIIRMAGVNESTIYRHFACKFEILSTLSKVGLERLEKALQEESQNETVIRPDKAFGACYISFALSNPHLFKLIFSEYSSTNTRTYETKEDPILLIFRNFVEGKDISFRSHPSILRTLSLAHGVACLAISNVIALPTKKDDWKNEVDILLS